MLHLSCKPMLGQKKKYLCLRLPDRVGTFFGKNAESKLFFNPSDFRSLKTTTDMFKIKAYYNIIHASLKSDGKEKKKVESISHLNSPLSLFLCDSAVEQQGYNHH